MLAHLVIFVQFFLVASYQPSFNTYHSYESYLYDLNNLIQDECEPFVIQIDQGASVQNRSIFTLHLTSYSNTSRPEKEKASILMVFGAHPREKIGPESALYLMWDLCTTNANLFDHIYLVIIPLLNPDGLIIQEELGTNCYRHNANGVDLNRNSDWDFYTSGGSSATKGDEEYRGLMPWSEPELKWLLNVSSSRSFYSYLEIHSGERAIYMPFGDVTSSKIKRERPTIEKEKRAMTQIIRRSRPFFTKHGITYEAQTYLANGCFYDYLGGTTDIPFIYLLEIWGNESEKNCFLSFNPRPAYLSTALQRIQRIYLILFYCLVDGLDG